MRLFPILLTIIIALSAVIALIQVFKAKKGEKETDNFINRYIKRLDDELVSNGAAMDAKGLLIFQFILQGILFAVGWLVTNMWWIGVALLCIGFLVPRLYVSIAKSKNNEKFENNLKIILNHMAALIGAGYSIPQAIEDTAKFQQIDKNQRKLFAQMDAMYKMGTSIPDCFKWYAEKTNSKDAYSVYSAIKMQAEIGGSEANIMKDLAESIQKRIKNRSEVSNIMAETNMTMRIFDIAPFAMVAIFFVISPDYLQFYFSTPDGFGILALLIAVIVAGSFILKLMKRKIRM